MSILNLFKRDSDDPPVVANVGRVSVTAKFETPDERGEITREFFGKFIEFSGYRTLTPATEYALYYIDGKFGYKGPVETAPASGKFIPRHCIYEYVMSEMKPCYRTLKGTTLENPAPEQIWTPPTRA